MGVQTPFRSAALATLTCIASGCGGTHPVANTPAPSSGAPESAEGAVPAPVVLRGSDFPLHSAGSAEGDSWRLASSGYAATYIRVVAPTQVSIAVDASATATGGDAPRVGIAIADHRRVFDMGGHRATHRMDVQLPAGTYILRVDFPNGGSGRELSLHQLALTGAELLPGNTEGNALAAANTYIQHYRRGSAKVRLEGIAPGTPVKVELERHAFAFGANIPFAENKLIPEVVTPGSDAERFQSLLLDHFNAAVLSNGGKWVYHEPERDRVNMAYVDRFLDFAAEHGLYARMHTLIWDTEQQPAWVVSTDQKTPGLLTRAHQGDAEAKRELYEEIDERIDDYVKQRARRYQELDVLNESLHRPRYYQVMGDDGLAELFRKVDAAVKSSGGSTRLYLNEYNLLQWSRNPLEAGSEPNDPYANWYRHHAEAVIAKGGPVTGLGVQYYCDGRTDEIGDNAHSPARIAAVLQNLSGLGLPITLSEFAVNPGPSPERGAEVLEETLRIVFGTPQTNAFLMWATWANAAQNPPPVSILMDGKDQLTPAGLRYEALMKEWDTELEVPVAADGSIELTGFYGQYAVTAGGETRCFELEKGTTEYTLTAAARSSVKPNSRRRCPPPER